MPASIILLPEQVRLMVLLTTRGIEIDDVRTVNVDLLGGSNDNDNLDLINDNIRKCDILSKRILDDFTPLFHSAVVTNVDILARRHKSVSRSKLYRRVSNRIKLIIQSECRLVDN
jgi:hypothetical protein